MSVKDVASKLRVSEVTIYNKLKLKELETLIVKKQGKTMITDDLFSLIKESLNLNKSFNNESIKEEFTEEKPRENADDETLKRLINSLTEQLKVKDIQLSAKDTQIEKLTKLLENEQVLRKQMIEAPKENQEVAVDDNDSNEILVKKHWWNRKIK